MVSLDIPQREYGLDVSARVLAHVSCTGQLVFQNRAREVGWKQAVKERDRGDPIYSKL